MVSKVIEHNAESLVMQSPRKRVNLKQSAKGNIQFDITVEEFSKSNEEVVQEIKDLKEAENFSPARITQDL